MARPNVRRLADVDEHAIAETLAEAVLWLDRVRRGEVDASKIQIDAAKAQAALCRTLLDVDSHVGKVALEALREQRKAVESLVSQLYAAGPSLLELPPGSGSN